MPKEQFPLDDFIMDVDPRYVDFVREFHDYLLTNGCTVGIERGEWVYRVVQVRKDEARAF